MASSQNNKKRRGKDSLSKQDPDPVVFMAPGLIPDVRITVFNQQYQVHSVALKYHSAFFRKFLDSPEKERIPGAREFKYEYVAVVDDDATWALEPAEKAKPPTKDSIARVTDADFQKECFHKLLCAIHSRPYRIHNVEEIVTITKLADFYCALPVLSNTLSGALFGSSIFKDKDDEDGEDGKHFVYHAFTYQASKILLLAKKLRHADLFRECFIHVVATFRSNVLNCEKQCLKHDKEIWLLLMEHHLKLCESILKVNQGLNAAVSKNILTFPKDFPHIAYSSMAPQEEVRFFVALRNHLRLIDGGFGPIPGILKDLDHLLKDNLKFDLLRCGVGKGSHMFLFLNAEIADKDLPWDTTQVDW